MNLPRPPTQVWVAAYTPAPMDQRLLRRATLDERTGCWVWRGATYQGYGRIQLRRGKLETVHRVAAMLWLGLEAKSKLQALHKCNNRRCFNPEHLYLGTIADNMRDRKSAGGYQGMGGGRNPSAKLNWDAVRLIRELCAKGYSQRRLERVFGLSHTAMNEIATNKSWIENQDG